jgi:hypothetical protein
MVKYKSFFHLVLIFAKAHIMPFIYLNMSLYTVMRWFRVTECFFNIHRVQCRNGLRTFMTHLRMVNSSCVVKSGRYSLNFGSLSHLGVNSRTQSAHSCNTFVKFHHVFTFIVGSMAMHTIAIMIVNELVSTTRCQRNQYRKHSLPYKGQFQYFQNSSNMYFLSYLH